MRGCRQDVKPGNPSGLQAVHQAGQHLSVEGLRQEGKVTKFTNMIQVQSYDQIDQIKDLKVVSGGAPPWLLLLPLGQRSLCVARPPEKN